MVSPCTNSWNDSMLRTPVSTTVRRLNAGQRSSLPRSSITEVPSPDSASRHGPCPVSYWIASTRTATSSVAATVCTPPRRRMSEIAAWSHPSIASTAVRVIRSWVSSGVVSACSRRAIAAKSSARPSSACPMRAI